MLQHTQSHQCQHRCCRHPVQAEALAAPVGLRHHLGRRRACSRRALSELVTIAAGDAGQTLQDLIVGGFVVTAVGAALYGGLNKGQTLCDLCQGTGGAKCFACQGQGSMQQLITVDDLPTTPKRDPVGRRASRPNECRVCKGLGIVPCSKCGGSGLHKGFRM